MLQVKNRLMTTLTMAMFALGLVFIGKACYIHLKAEAAQVLMASAWERSRQSGIARPPWSWADTQVIGTIHYRDTQQYILAGESGRNLAFGPTWMSASTPIERVGNTVIVGHRDTHFKGIQHLQKGDIIVIDGMQSKAEYEVSELAIIQSTDTGVLAHTDQAVLTLITCYPFDAVNADPKLRYVVRAIKKAANKLTAVN